MSEDLDELERWLLREVSAQEEANETFDLTEEFVSMEAAHEAKANHVRVDHILLHFLSLR